MVAVSERIKEFGDAEIVVVTFSDAARLDAYVKHLDITFPVVTDVDRELYQALGLERGTRRQVWSLGTLQKYWHLLRAGKKLQRTHEDIRQLGADVIVGADGRIIKIFRPATPADRPSVDDLLAHLGDSKT